MRKNKIYLYSLIALSMSIAGCSNEDKAPHQEGTHVAFNAEFSNEFKKLSYGETTDESGATGRITPILWDAGDKVYIYSPTSASGAIPQTGLYTATPQLPNKTAADFNFQAGQRLTWSPALPQQFYSICPAGAGSFVQVGGTDFIQVAVPRQQELSAENKWGMDNLVLYAAANVTEQTSRVSLTYDHVVTMLAVELDDATHTIAAVEIVGTGENAGKIAGTFRGRLGATIQDTENPITDFHMYEAEKSGKVKVQFPDGLPNKQPFYIALAPFDLESLTITLFDTEGNAAQIVNTSGITARRLYKINKDNLEWKPAPSTKVDMGIRVVNSYAADGTITTDWIGHADGSYAWDVDVAGNGLYTVLTNTTVPQNAEVLYFADGNLFVDKDGNNPYVGLSKKSSSDKCLFGWGDITGIAEEPQLEKYPANVVAIPREISGGPHDIARVKLGGKWRLFTVEEMAFLMQGRVVDDITTPTSSNMWNRTNNYGTSNYQSGSQIWNQGLTLTSIVAGGDYTGNSIFLPAMGTRTGGSSYVDSNTHRYWSGSLGHNDNEAYRLWLQSHSWQIGGGDFRYNGLSVRPVMSE